MTNSASVPKIFSTLLVHRSIINIWLGHMFLMKKCNKDKTYLCTFFYFSDYLLTYDFDYRLLLIGMVKRLSFRPVTHLHETAGKYFHFFLHIFFIFFHLLNFFSLISFLFLLDSFLSLFSLLILHTLARDCR